MRLCGKCFGDDDDSEESDGSSLGFTDFEISTKLIRLYHKSPNAKSLNP